MGHLLQPFYSCSAYLLSLPGYLAALPAVLPQLACLLPGHRDISLSTCCQTPLDHLLLPTAACCEGQALCPRDNGGRVSQGEVEGEVEGGPRDVTPAQLASRRVVYCACAVVVDIYRTQIY